MRNPRYAVLLRELGTLVHKVGVVDEGGSPALVPLDPGKCPPERSGDDTGCPAQHTIHTITGLPHSVTPELAGEAGGRESNPAAVTVAPDTLTIGCEPAAVKYGWPKN